jgi:hypothetical protein
MTVTGQLTAESSAGGEVTPLPEAEPHGPDAENRPPGSHGWKTLVLGAGAYLLLSVVVWSQVWHHPTATTTCGCGDTSLFTWFLEWPAYAMAHGLNPFYSTAIHVPGGVNLLANTSVVAIGFILAPITWLFGPVATLNVALTLAPALSALSMYVLLRRWVTWAPAAFVGGLLYGFSPLILVSLSDAHLMLGMAVVPPLIVACLDELLFRQRRRPVPTGIVLGLLVALQFFIGTEVLVIMVAIAAAGVVIVVGYAAWRRPSELRAHARYAATGLASGSAVAIVLLIGPAWYALSGPAHFGSVVWPGIYGHIARKQRTTPDLFFNRWSTLNSAVATLHNRVLGGYQGRVLSYQYFGSFMAVVVVGGLVAWRRDRRLWFFAAIAAISVLLSFGARKGIWLPWRALENLPILQNVVPYRFILITYLAVAVMLGLIVEHTYVAVNRRRAAALTADGKRADGTERTERTGGTHRADETDRTDGTERTGPTDRSPWARLPRWAGAAAATVVAVFALVQPVSYMSLTVPMTTAPVDLPTWFTRVAPHLPDHQVLLILPAPFTSFDNSMTWQAVDHMDFSMVGEGGPGGILVQSGKELAGATVLAAESSPNVPVRSLTAQDVTGVRQALDGWKVTTVVVPDQPGLPIYDQISSVTSAAALITAATGQRPVHQSDAWVWTGLNRAHTVVPVSSERLAACLKGVDPHGVPAVDRATACVLASPGAVASR